MDRTQIKICGIARPEDAAAIANAGMDAIGLVFYRHSSRAVDPVQAREIISVLPPFTSAVALFLDAREREVEDVLETVPVDLLQFHGSESAAFCRRFGRRWIKAVGMGGGTDLGPHVARYPDAAAILVDGHPPGAPGGTGNRLDWQSLPGERSYRLVLAGGLNPGNVAQAIGQVQPDAVDVSSGVERTKGIKDAGLVRQFIEEARRGDASARTRCV